MLALERELMTVAVRIAVIAALAAAAAWCAQMFTRAGSDTAQCVYGLAAGLVVGGLAVLAHDTLQALLHPSGHGEHKVASAQVRDTSSA